MPNHTAHRCACGRAIHSDTNTTASSCNRLCSLPFTSHPIYHFRKYSIIVALLGAFLCASSANGMGGPIDTSVPLLIFSALFCAADLFCYAKKKSRNPDEEPEWPSKLWMCGDVVFALLLQVTFWACLNELTWSYSSRVLAAYGALGDMICS